MATTHYTSKVVLYSGVPFDPSYENILSPANTTVKKSLLDGLYGHAEFNDIMFVKLNTTTGEGQLRLACNANAAVSFNYAYISDGKTDAYFAFVLGCQYINDGTSENGVQKCVYEFDIKKDVVMSHLISDRQLMACPIVRHTSTSIFNNAKVPESYPAINLMNYSYVDAFSSMSFYTVAFFIESENYLGSDICNVPCGVHVKIYTDTTNALIDLSQILNQDNGRICALFRIPTFMYNGPFPTGNGVELHDNHIVKNTTTRPMIGYNSTQGHIDLPSVSNNKCYYYPFNMLRVYANDGSHYDCAFEDCTDDFPSFRVENNPLPPVYFTVKPMNYRNSADNPMGYKIKTTSWPMGSYNEDSYSIYLANRYNDPDNAFKQFGQVQFENLGSTISAGVQGGMAGGPIGALMGAGLSVVGAQWKDLQENMAAARATDSVGGTTTSGGSDNTNDKINVTFSHVALRPELFPLLDDYFSTYGYAQGGVINKPDLEGRDSYVYVQTGGKCFKPTAVPAEPGNEEPNQNESMIINNVFMNGVTVWKTSAFTGSFYHGSNGMDPVPRPNGSA